MFNQKEFAAKLEANVDKLDQKDLLTWTRGHMGDLINAGMVLDDMLDNDVQMTCSLIVKGLTRSAMLLEEKGCFDQVDVVLPFAICYFISMLDKLKQSDQA